MELTDEEIQTAKKVIDVALATPGRFPIATRAAIGRLRNKLHGIEPEKPVKLGPIDDDIPMSVSEVPEVDPSEDVTQPGLPSALG